MDIESLLKKYRTNSAKIRCGELEIEGLKAYLDSGQYNSMIESFNREKDKEIEGMSLKQNVSDSPRSVTNKFHSIVEDVAEGYKKEYYKSPPSRQYILERIAIIESRIEPLRADAKLVDEVILPCLGDKERFIIASLYIDGYSWNEITNMYAERYDAREERTLKDMRGFALKKIREVLNPH